MITDVDNLIRVLILEQRKAIEPEIQRIIAHVVQRPVSSYLMRVNFWLRQELDERGVPVPLDKLPSVQIHLLKRIYYDGQWPLNTSIVQFEDDLHKAVLHPDVQLWTYRWLGEYFAGFIAPSHVLNVPSPEKFIFVAYVADYGTIKTGFQVSDTGSIFTDAFENLVRHK